MRGHALFAAGIVAQAGRGPLRDRDPDKILAVDDAEPDQQLRLRGKPVEDRLRDVGDAALVMLRLETGVAPRWITSSKRR